MFPEDFEGISEILDARYFQNKNQRYFLLRRTLESGSFQHGTKAGKERHAKCPEKYGNNGKR